MYQIATHRVASHNTCLFPHGPGAWVSTMGLAGPRSRCRQGCVPFWRLQGRILFLAFSGFRRLPASLGSWCLPPAAGHRPESPSVSDAAPTCGSAPTPRPQLADGATARHHDSRRRELPALPSPAGGERLRHPRSRAHPGGLAVRKYVSSKRMKHPLGGNAGVR